MSSAAAFKSFLYAWGKRFVQKYGKKIRNDYGSFENEDPENEDSKTRRPLTKTKTPYENEDPLRKRQPTTKTKIPSFLTRAKQKTDRVIWGQEDI